MVSSQAKHRPIPPPYPPPDGGVPPGGPHRPEWPGGARGGGWHGEGTGCMAGSSTRGQGGRPLCPARIGGACTSGGPRGGGEGGQVRPLQRVCGGSRGDAGRLAPEVAEVAVKQHNGDYHPTSIPRIGEGSTWRNNLILMGITFTVKSLQVLIFLQLLPVVSRRWLTCPSVDDWIQMKDWIHMKDWMPLKDWILHWGSCLCKEKHWRSWPGTRFTEK